MSSSHDASLLAHVKSVFRAEFKERDERCFDGRRGDLEVSIRPESTYPKAIIRFTDTCDGGLVAITVPAALSSMIIGHPTGSFQYWSRRVPMALDEVISRQLIIRWFPIDMPESGDVWGESDSINW